MKQRITIKDKSQLTEKQKEKYTKFCKKHEYGEFINKNPNSYRCELLTIGQLVELLYEKKALHNYHAIDGCYEQRGNGWHVVLKGKDTYTIEEDELCDGLWKAVKAVL